MNKTTIMAVAVATASLFAHDLPICEEFAGEANVQCVRTEDRAIVISRHNGGVTYELYGANGKGYIETDGDGSVFANTSNTQINLTEMSEDSEELLNQILAYVAKEINF